MYVILDTTLQPKTKPRYHIVKANVISEDGDVDVEERLDFTSRRQSTSMAQQFMALLEAILPFDQTQSWQLGGSYSSCHYPAMFATAVQTGAKTILELGSEFGHSALPLLLGAHVTNAVVHSVDIVRSPFTPPHFLHDRWHFHHSSTLQYLEQLDPSVVFDLVWLDDWHAGLT